MRGREAFFSCFYVFKFVSMAAIRPQVELITTGSELLLGITLNSHLSWVGNQLFALGLELTRNVTIGDGEVIGEEIGRAIAAADVVIVTGGLGPTEDDLTCQQAAKVLGKECYFDAQVWQNIEAYMQKRGKQATSLQKRQAWVPLGAQILPNQQGTAPGILFLQQDLAEKRAKLLVLLPGPPSELQPMFLQQLVPYLIQIEEEFRGDAKPIVLQNWKLVGIGESEVEQQLVQFYPAWQRAGLEVGYCARAGEVDVRFIGDALEVEQASKQLEQQFPQQLIGDASVNLVEHVVEKLRDRGETIALAESCTGGALASKFTELAGVSKVFLGSIVSYQNELKTNLLGVPEELLERFGAVSKEVVEAMASGVLRETKADWAIAISGIAGPDGGSEEKPVGTVWIALAGGGKLAAQCFVFRGNRKKIQEFACLKALDWLRLQFL